MSAQKFDFEIVGYEDTIVEEEVIEESNNDATIEKEL